MAGLCFILVAILCLAENAKAQTDYSFPGSMSDDLLVTGDVQNLRDRITFRPSSDANNQSQAFYIKSISSPTISFSSSFVFRLSGSDGMRFGLVGTSYNYPTCVGSVSIYSCDGLYVYFNGNGTDQVEIGILSRNISFSNAISPVSLSKNLTLHAWMDYNPPSHPHLVRVWIALNGTSRPSSPLLEYNVSMDEYSYFFPGFSGCHGSPGNSSCMQTVYSWSFSVAHLSQPTHRRNKVWIVLLTVFIAAGSLATLYIMFRVRRHIRMVRAARKHVLEASNPLVSYSYRELRFMTRNFREVIGKGGSSTVYKGKIETGPTSFFEVAVKDMSNSESASEHQFMDELRVISRVRHQNLVALKGWCQEDGKLLLVYEFMSNGSLDKLLFTSSSSEQHRYLTSWNQRLDIIKSVAEALVYLHEGLERRVIHRDIKAANVLLDEKMKAKLGDFGLARLMTNTIGDQTMTRAGTMGYISPELAYTGRATEKSDVYSFGVLVLEIVAGRRSVENRYAGVDDDSVLLLELVWIKHQMDELSQLFDPRMMVDDIDINIVNGEQAEEVLKLGLLCCSVNPADRPTMRMCCQVLSGDSKLPVLGGQQQPDLVFNIEDFQEHSSSLLSEDFELSASLK